MSDTAVRRPPILTGACLYLGTLAAIMSIRAVVIVSSWNAENRAADFSAALRALRDAGLSADGAENAYRGLLTAVAVLGACAVVFAVYAARGQASSRLGLTITIGLTGLMSFLGVLGGTFVFAMVGALAVVFTIRLWTGDIRTYFRTLAGHAPPPPKEPVTASAPPAPAAPVAAPVAPPTAPTYTLPPGYGPPPGREPLPPPVAFAVWSTLIGSIAAAGLSALMLFVIAVGGLDYDVVKDVGGPGSGMIRSESDFDRGINLLTVLSSMAVVLGLAGAAAATRALAKRRSGGVPLFVLTVVTIVVSGLGFPIGLPWTILAVVVLFQLRKPAARAWFASI